MISRFAPSPSGDLHIGNLRTALLAWAYARKNGHQFVLRFDDLDRVKEGAINSQRADLSAIGLEWDEEIFQSDRIDRYTEVLAELTAKDITYECFCSRKDILSAPSAPHSPPGAYPGTCRDLPPGQLPAKRAALPSNKSAAIRLKVSPHLTATYTAQDIHDQPIVGSVDDLVLVRGDGVFAYNFTSVIDDIDYGITHIVRGNDLQSSAPRQQFLLHLLGGKTVNFLHVPMVLAPSGARLAKRDGAVTLRDLNAQGYTTSQVVKGISASIGCQAETATELVAALDIDNLPTTPWIFTPGNI